MRKGLLLACIMAALMASGDAWGQDPGLQDSMIFGNLNRAPIAVAPGQQVTIPVWFKSDDSVTFTHIPLASDNHYIVSRDSGSFFPPYSLWDDVSFLRPDTSRPSSGFTSQSMLGFAYLIDPRDDQNFLYTDYQWIHIADFRMTATSDPGIAGDSTHLAPGFNPYNGDLLLGLQDGMSGFAPATVYTWLKFPTSDIKGAGGLPEKSSLLGAYPNPFNSVTSIKFALSASSDVKLTLYNASGQLVRTIYLSTVGPGQKTVTWDGTNDQGRPVASGVYLYRIEAGEFSASARVTLLK